ncbi:MAG: aspartate kinase [Coriobacteriales bacterium]|nr:aspartate kinase [Coriobacteriales bacterium]
MSLVVAKFGGSSVATPERVKNIAHLLVERKSQGDDVVAVVSAMGSTTDNLIDLAKAVNAHPSGREMDNLMSTGELVSMSVLALAIEQLGEKAMGMNGRQVGIITNDDFGNAQIKEIHTDRIHEALKEGYIVIVAGFQGIDEDGDITTLGRGGSDTTAVAIAASLGADVCEIYTDVDGVYSADPRVVGKAQKLDRISYEEMLELAAAGSGVLHKRCVEFARNFDVKIHTRSSFENVPGTIVEDMIDVEKAIVSGVAYDNSEAKFTLRGVEDTQGVAAKVFNELAKRKISVDMIIQNISENGFTDISFTSPTSELENVKKILEELLTKLSARSYQINDNISKISIVGAGMKANSGVAAKMFQTLADEGINISMISTSDIRTSVVIDQTQFKHATQCLHTAFGLDGTEIFEDNTLSEQELKDKANKGR